MITEKEQDELLRVFPRSRRDGIDLEDSVKALARVIIVCTNELVRVIGRLGNMPKE